MTVYESVASWLKEILDDPENGFPQDVSFVEAETIPAYRRDFQHLNVLDTALISNSNDIHTPLLGGQVRHTEFKTWYLVMDFQKIPDRRSNEAFMEMLRKRIYRKNLKGIGIMHGRKWHEIAVNGGMIVGSISSDNKEAVYQIPLRITYME